MYKLSPLFERINIRIPIPYSNEVLKMKKILETDRLLLRELTPNDATHLYDIYGQPDMLKFISNGKRGTFEEEVTKIDRHIHQYYPTYGYGLWATILKKTNTLIGRCGLLYWEIENKPEVEVAYLIDRNYWGQGLATEAARGIRDFAFQEKHVERCISLIAPTNLASRKVAEKNGMTIRKSIEFLGYSNLCLYSINKNEWNQLYNKSS